MRFPVHAQTQRRALRVMLLTRHARSRALPLRLQHRKDALRGAIRIKSAAKLWQALETSAEKEAGGSVGAGGNGEGAIVKAPSEGPAAETSEHNDNLIKCQVRNASLAGCGLVWPATIKTLT